MGLGRFGGGVGAARFLATKGARVLVTDLADEAALADSLASLGDLLDEGAITLRLGQHDERDFTAADLVVVSPAVRKPWENRFVVAARRAGAVLTTEVRLLVERLPDRAHVIGVTGTAGKSTTAAMIAHALEQCAQMDSSESCPTKATGRSADRAAGRVFLGGNIGGSLLDQIDAITARDWVVLELSSAQLHWLGELGLCAGFPPGVAVVTNLAPNHLDWHGSFAHYAKSKACIAQGQGEGDALLLGPSVEEHAAFDVAKLQASCIECIDEPLGRDAPNALPGVHNRRNAALALRATERALAQRPGSLDAAVLSGFTGLPHRLQLAMTIGEGAAAIRVVNDSKSTTPDATALAIAAFDERGEVGASRVHLICGGYDKCVDLSAMVKAAARCASVHTIGATGSALVRAIAASGGVGRCCGTLDEAVIRASGDLQAGGRGGVLLLSPGCASWDQFRDFEARGERFVALARTCLQKLPEQT